MKIKLLTDRAGNILAALDPVQVQPFASANTLDFDPSDDHLVHQLELPDLLTQHALAGTLYQQLFKFRIKGSGKSARFVK